MDDPQSAYQLVIREFHERPLLRGVKRDFSPYVVEGKASVIVGVRRCGKSTWLRQRAAELVESGVSLENILFINLFDDRLRHVRSSGLGPLLEAYYAMYPHKRGKEKVYVFLDEIQIVDDWEPFVDRLLRAENTEVYLSGSSANLLSREVSTEMRGRALTWELHPFSFKEFLRLAGAEVEADEKFSPARQALVTNIFQQYWLEGSFPEVFGLPDPVRTRIHQEYFHGVLYRDVIERYNVNNPRAVSELCFRLMRDAASLYSQNRLYQGLKSQGLKLDKQSVGDWLDWFEDAYFLFSVRIYDSSLNRANTNPKKIYCADHALIRSVAGAHSRNSGHLLENLAFVTLRRMTERVAYYKSKSGHEVDFVAELERGMPTLVQVAESIDREETRKRELRSLRYAMNDLGLKRAFVVTMYEQETISVEEGTIHVLPMWRFLLYGEKRLREELENK